MINQVLDSVWYHPPINGINLLFAVCSKNLPSIGIVKYLNSEDEICFKIGIVEPTTEKQDAKYIAYNGAKFDPNIFNHMNSPILQKAEKWINQPEQPL